MYFYTLLLLYFTAHLLLRNELLRVLCAVCESVQFAKYAARDLARVTLVRIRVRVSFRSEICKLCMRDFEIARRSLQITQIN